MTKLKKMENIPEDPEKGNQPKRTAFMTFTDRQGHTLFIRPEDIPVIGAHVSDGTQTRVFVKGIIDQIIIKDTPQNVMCSIDEFERK